MQSTNIYNELNNHSANLHDTMDELSANISRLRCVDSCAHDMEIRTYSPEVYYFWGPFCGEPMVVYARESSNLGVRKSYIDTWYDTHDVHDHIDNLQ